MSEISLELTKLWRQYGGDVKQIIREHGQLEYFYALSDIRENLLEWYEFAPEASLLQVGADEGALTGLFARRVKTVTVLDPSEEELALVRERWGTCPGGLVCRQGGLLDLPAGETYDYVVMIGSLKPPCGEMVSRAKACLKPGGRLLVAVCNPFGLKYQAGAPKDAASFSKAEISRLLLGEGTEEADGAKEGDGSLAFYYPMPDYKTPSVIYSDLYLPVKGDLTHVVQAYGYPRYIRLDEGEMYDAVCENHQFDTYANSYLIIWSGHEDD